MKEVAKVIQQIGSTGSYSAKLDLLKKHADVPGLQEILRFIYNPYCKTGISEAKLNKAWWPAKFSPVTWQEAIEYFSKHQTGSADDVAYGANFIGYSQVTYEDSGSTAVLQLARAIVTQNLKIGVTATSLNNAYGKDFIPKTGCMLGTPYADVGAHRVAWPCIVTEKLDGVRRVLVKKDGVCHMYSRSGHEDTGLVDVLKEATHLPDNYVYDGELLAIGAFKDCIAQRQATNSIANSKGKRSGLTFNVFDMVPVEDFFKGTSKDNAKTRKILLGATLMDESISVIDPEMWWHRIQAFGVHSDLEFIKPVPILGLVNSLEDVTPIVEKVWTRGGEGVMLNTINGLYEIKRSKSLLKVKHTEEHKLQVVDLLEGTGKYEDSLGAVVVAYKNSFVGVGSGFTDAQRHAVWKHPERYIGRYAEVETFGESTNAQGFVSLNCPIFKRFVGEVE